MRKPNQAPYEIPLRLCQSCFHADDCPDNKEAKGEIYDCEWFATAREILIQKQKEDDLTFLVNTLQGMRLYRDELNEGMIFEDNIFTNNAGSHYNLGMRDRDLSKMRALMKILQLDTPSQLMAYLEIQIKKGELGCQTQT